MAVCTTQSGPRRQHGLGVVGGGHAQGAPQAGQVPGVAAHLVGVRHPDTHELEVGAGVDAGQRVPTHVARAPQHDAGTSRQPPQPRSTWGRSAPPSISKILPVTKSPAGDAR